MNYLGELDTPTLHARRRQRELAMFALNTDTEVLQREIEEIDRELASRGLAVTIVSSTEIVD